MNCIFCEVEGAEGSLLVCSRCELLIPKEIRQLKPSQLIDKRWALASYDSPVGAALRRAKFGKELVLMQRLADVLSEGVQKSELGDIDVVTHIPTSLRREFLRGFDSSASCTRRTRGKTCGRCTQVVYCQHQKLCRQPGRGKLPQELGGEQKGQLPAFKIEHLQEQIRSWADAC